MFRSVALVTLLFGVGPHTAAAQPAANDLLMNATAVTSAPFTDTIGTHEATSDADDLDCATGGLTVWYAFRSPRNMSVQVDTFGSDYDTTLAAAIPMGTTPQLLACNDDTDGTLTSRISFNANAGQLYLIGVGAWRGDRAGNLVFSINPVLQTRTGMAITVAKARVNAETGFVRVSGSVVCGDAPDVTIRGEVVQQRHGRTVSAWFALPYRHGCSGDAIPFSLSAAPSLAAGQDSDGFGKGALRIRAWVIRSDGVSATAAAESRTVTVKIR
jgi:hypothetical protein